MYYRQLPIQKKYNIIYADPPWKFNNQALGIKQIEDHYPTMTRKELMSLPIQKIAADDCALFMWTTNAHLDEAIELMQYWGFKYKTIAFTWVKLNKDLKPKILNGPWFLSSTEICLMGVKGRPRKYKTVHDIRSLVTARVRKHSQKPMRVRLNIERAFTKIPRIELFAREEFDGWDCWGNELSCFGKPSLEEAINKLDTQILRLNAYATG